MRRRPERGRRTRSTRFRCQIGHAFSTDTLLAAQDEELEKAMASALRMHRERVALFRKMQEKSEAQAMPHAAARWRTGATNPSRPPG